MSLIVIPVTGGPCAGKTTVMNAVKKQFGEQVLVMPEVASLLLDNGFPRPGEDVDFSDRWMDAFQHSVFPVQKNMEAEYRVMAERHITRVLLCDRGLLDGAAYLAKGVPFFLDLFGMDLEDVHARYDRVLHLESVAVSDPKLYKRLKKTNPARYEDAPLAVERDLALREVWKDHPQWTLITSEAGIKHVVQEVTTLIASYLSTEIEVKYRLLAPPPTELLVKSDEVLQGYFPMLEGELRFRKMGEEHHYLTIKGDGDLNRGECERAIDPWAFNQVYPETLDRRVEKTRYFIPYNGHTLEIDFYHGHLEGLMTLECELPSEDAVESFVLPEWATGAINVTSDKRYKNKNLALGTIPSLT